MASAPSVSQSSNNHDWRAQLGSRLVQADEAVSHIKSGDRVMVSIAQATPLTACTALAARLMEIENVVVNHGAAAFNWDLPGLGERYRLESNVLLAARSRGVMRPGARSSCRSPTIARARFRRGWKISTSISSRSPRPMKTAIVNFGDIQIMQKMLARKADLVIAEIEPN